MLGDHRIYLCASLTLAMAVFAMTCMERYISARFLEPYMQGVFTHTFGLPVLRVLTITYFQLVRLALNRLRSTA
jgi:hypothetical protein